MPRPDPGCLAETCLRRSAELGGNTTSLLRDLIAIPSPSGGEKEVADRVLLECARLGLSARRDPRGSVIAVLGGGSFGLLYDAHLDTVGPGERSAWAWDPFRGKLEAGVVFGRGASDNKGALAAMVTGLRIAAEIGLPARVRASLIGVVEEEVCEGWAVGEAIDRGDVAADWVVLGECTDLGLALGHRGRLELELATEGLSCHGSSPWRGRNAIYVMTDWIAALRRAEEGLPRSPTLGPASLSVTSVAAASGSPNVVPDRCRAVLDRRTIPGEDEQDVLADLVRLAPDGAACRVTLVRYLAPSYTGFAKDVPKAFPAWELAGDHALTRAAAAAVALVRGEPPALGRWEFATDGVATAGRLGLPTAGFGPGEERFAHTVEDQVPQRQLVVAAAVYALLPFLVAETAPALA